MSTREQQKEIAGARRLSHHWSGVKQTTRAQRTAATAGAEAPSGGGDADVTNVFIIDWSALDGPDVLA